MPRYYVGLDFGTHQTKVCIRDTSKNPEVFSFLEFDNKSVLCPSLIQINKDSRVSYGQIDNNNCKEEGSQIGDLDDFKEQYPIIHLPPRPENIKTKTGSIKKLIELLGLSSAKTKSFETILEEWEAECLRIKQEFGKVYDTWEKRTKEFERRKKSVESTPIKRYCYKYFKLACFNEQYSIRFKNENGFEGDIISQWFLAYILFIIEEKIGSDYFLQMGIPSGIDKSELEKQKNKAYNLLVSSFEMMKHYKSIKNFLNADFRELLTYSTDKTYKDIFNYPFEVIPEAYCSLQSLVKNGKLQGGIYLLVDIGGGTTDVALFNVNLASKEPTIYSVRSFALGLNDVYEKYNELSNSTMTLSEVQSFFNAQKKCDHMLNSISNYHGRLKEQLNVISTRLEREFQRSNKAGWSVKKLWDAINFQVKVFSGGGSMHRYMTNFNFKFFKDSLIINKDIIAHNSIFTNKHEQYEDIFPILANSYGLTVFHPDKIQEESIASLFSHFRDFEPEEKTDIYVERPRDRFDNSDWD
jgi:hypothetical protein